MMTKPARALTVWLMVLVFAMKVNFYAIDQEKLNKGEYLGFAELKDGKLAVEIKDEKLSGILNKKYCTRTGGMDKNGGMWDGIACYEPGTPEHLNAIAAEAMRLGYISEEVKE
jgi:hypothetical protein